MNRGPYSAEEPPQAIWLGRSKLRLSTAPSTFLHSSTNGQVERMNGTLKEATVKRYHYDRHDQLEQHLKTFLAAYNYAKRLKTLKGLTSYEYICKCWTETPDRFRLNPLHHTAGLNT